MIWRILYDNGDEVYVAQDTLEDAIEYARSQQDLSFSQVMEISKVQEREERA